LKDLKDRIDTQGEIVTVHIDLMIKCFQTLKKNYESLSVAVNETIKSQKEFQKKMKVDSTRSNWFAVACVVGGIAILAGVAIVAFSGGAGVPAILMASSKGIAAYASATFAGATAIGCSVPLGLAGHDGAKTVRD
jgi:hypothetical protein